MSVNVNWTAVAGILLVIGGITLGFLKPWISNFTGRQSSEEGEGQFSPVATVSQSTKAYHSDRVPSQETQDYVAAILDATKNLPAELVVQCFETKGITKAQALAFAIDQIIKQLQNQGTESVENKVVKTMHS